MEHSAHAFEKTRAGLEAGAAQGVAAIAIRNCGVGGGGESWHNEAEALGALNVQGNMARLANAPRRKKEKRGGLARRWPPKKPSS